MQKVPTIQMGSTIQWRVSELTLISTGIRRNE